MPKFEKVIVWMESSIHFDPIWNSIQNKHNIPVVHVSMSDSPFADRVALGWKVLLDPAIERKVIATADEARGIVQAHDSAAHVFLGTGRRDPYLTGFRTALQAKHPSASFLEVPQSTYFFQRNFKGRVGDFLHSLRAIQNRNLGALLTLGSDAKNWALARGYKPNQVVPFAYPVNAIPVDGTQSPEATFGYLGRLETVKGVQYLPAALNKIKHLDWNMKVIGFGSLEDQLKQELKDFGLLDRVAFLGQMAPEDARREIQSCQVSVMPSNHDGWSVAVAESLAGGIPVVCSDRVGAREIVLSSRHGEVFQSRNVDDLAKKLTSAIGNLDRYALQRQSVIDWSSCYNSDAIASYVLEVLNGNRPQPQWQLSPAQS